MTLTKNNSTLIIIIIIRELLSTLREYAFLMHEISNSCGLSKLKCHDFFYSVLILRHHPFDF